MRNTFLVLAISLLLIVAAGGVGLAQSAVTTGLVTVDSVYGVDETTDRLESTLRDRGLIVVARVDHAANARRVGKELRPTQLLIFGNPQLGTELMQSRQTAGIDLPQKLLVWEDAAGQAHVTYNDPQYLAQRHGIEGEDQALAMISNALNGLASSVTTRGK